MRGICSLYREHCGGGGVSRGGPWGGIVCRLCGGCLGPVWGLCGAVRGLFSGSRGHCVVSVRIACGYVGALCRVCGGCAVAMWGLFRHAAFRLWAGYVRGLCGGLHEGWCGGCAGAQLGMCRSCMGGCLGFVYGLHGAVR